MSLLDDNLDSADSIFFSSAKKSVSYHDIYNLSRISTGYVSIESRRDHELLIVIF